MSPLLKALLAGGLGLLAILYLLPALLLWRGQDRILFPAPHLSAARLAALAQDAQATEVYAATADGLRLYGWHLRAGPPDASVLLYFHGNGESVALTRDVQQAALQAGWDFLCVSPRGYPGSEGQPSRGSLARDARAAWDLATDGLGYAPGQILLHGRSLGGGMAGTLMAEVAPAGLVLESTFRSLHAIGREVAPLYPVRLLLRHHAPTEERAPEVAYPVLLLHGDQDEVISISHARTLARLFPHARLVEAQGFGHNDNLLFQDPASRQAWHDYLQQRQQARPR